MPKLLVCVFPSVDKSVGDQVNVSNAQAQGMLSLKSGPYRIWEVKQDLGSDDTDAELEARVAAARSHAELDTHVATEVQNNAMTREDTRTLDVKQQARFRKAISQGHPVDVARKFALEAGDDADPVVLFDRQEEAVHNSSASVIIEKLELPQASNAFTLRVEDMPDEPTYNVAPPTGPSARDAAIKVNVPLRGPVNKSMTDNNQGSDTGSLLTCVGLAMPEDIDIGIEPSPPSWIDGEGKTADVTAMPLPVKSEPVEIAEAPVVSEQPVSTPELKAPKAKRGASASKPAKPKKAS